jgi:hypothetical protein
MNRLITTAILIAVFDLGACSDTKPPRKRLPYQALLGSKSDAAISHLKAQCTGTLRSDYIEPIEMWKCELPNNVYYTIDFDGRGRIIKIKINAPESDTMEIFDRVVTPIVPADIRDVMRRSIAEPDRFEFSKPGGLVFAFAPRWRRGEGCKTIDGSCSIMWHLEDYGAGDWAAE